MKQSDWLRLLFREEAAVFVAVHEDTYGSNTELSRSLHAPGKQISTAGYFHSGKRTQQGSILKLKQKSAGPSLGDWKYLRGLFPLPSTFDLGNVLKSILLWEYFLPCCKEFYFIPTLSSAEHFLKIQNSTQNSVF
jgi:hypothetical protein